MNPRTNISTKEFVIATAIALFGFSTPSVAIKATAECPASHSHMGHGESMGTDNMDMSKPHDMSSATMKYTQQECASCHGLHGMSHASDVPNLAGQNEIYLCQWLAGCRAEGKTCESHEDLSWKWTDQEISEMSEFYSHMHDFGKK